MVNTYDLKEANDNPVAITNYVINAMKSEGKSEEEIKHFSSQAYNLNKKTLIVLANSVLRKLNDLVISRNAKGFSLNKLVNYQEKEKFFGKEFIDREIGELKHSNSNEVFLYIKLNHIRLKFEEKRNGILSGYWIFEFEKLSNISKDMDIVIIEDLKQIFSKEHVKHTLLIKPETNYIIVQYPWNITLKP